jgi:AraC-like DNA-binding protein
MNETQQKKLAYIIDKYSRKEGENETPIPGVFLFRASTTDAALPSVYNPCLCIIAQGHKQVMLEKEIYRYGPSQYLTVSVDLPLMNRITKASKDAPYLLLKIEINVQQLSELLIHLNHSGRTNSRTERGIFVGDIDETMGDSVLRLARLLESPEEIPVLASQTLREVIYRVLCKDYGDLVAQVALKGSHMQRIASAIQKIKSDFHQSIAIEELAELAGMSLSSFHAHFKTVTAMSPLQFQKSLRLIEARSLMISKDMDAAGAAYQVGYESPSQFSREYARMFGAPPGRDIGILKRRQEAAAASRDAGPRIDH